MVSTTLQKVFYPIFLILFYILTFKVMVSTTLQKVFYPIGVLLLTNSKDYKILKEAPKGAKELIINEEIDYYIRFNEKNKNKAIENAKRLGFTSQF